MNLLHGDLDLEFLILLVQSLSAIVESTAKSMSNPTISTHMFFTEDSKINMFYCIKNKFREYFNFTSTPIDISIFISKNFL